LEVILLRKSTIACCLLALLAAGFSQAAERSNLSPQAQNYLRLRQSLGAQCVAEADLLGPRTTFRGHSAELLGVIIGRTNSCIATAERPITFMLQTPARNVVMIDARDDYPLIAVDRIVHVLAQLPADARPGDHFILHSLIAETDLPVSEQLYASLAEQAAAAARPQVLASTAAQQFAGPANDADKPIVVEIPILTPTAPRSVALPPRPGTQLPEAAAETCPNLPARTLAVWKQWVSGINGNLSEAQRETIVRAVLYYSALFGVDHRLAFAMIKCESDFDPRCLSHSGAMGLTQLMPGTAKGVGCNDPWDLEQNIRGGILYLSQMLKAYADRSNYDQFSLALASYNAGPNAVKRAGGVPNIPETIRYVRKVGDLFYKLFKDGMP
jgi:soluble lytic murein transglycosylase-like protein